MQKLKHLLLPALFLFSQSVYSQFTIQGRIVDSSSREPLGGASVYCQNTTLGTVTNKDGYFSLSLKSGGYDLVISFTGYQTQQVRISQSQPVFPDILLIKEDKSLGEVIIRSSNEVKDGWEKYGSFFIDHFIGTTPFSHQTQLENPEVLKFFFLKKSNKLRVLATEPLRIRNEALGYQLIYQLDSFVYAYNNDISTYRGFCLFSELEGTDSLRAIWTANREKTYLGSKLHFMRSYYDSTLAEDGFVIALQDLKFKNKFNSISNPYDTTYYGAMDSTQQIEIWFPRKASITYQRQKPEPEYLQQLKLPADVPIQISYVDLTDAIAIRENGYYYEQSAWINQGYWGWKNLADLLPYDYLP
ncbi:MAG: carboxypeptidase-like regulatory domain-containing protein [Chitinophagaceae bacterium]|nr:carboxypeptidase-like regulatory domain-containing protein [Chitinophagaceae bacterium]